MKKKRRSKDFVRARTRVLEVSGNMFQNAKRILDLSVELRMAFGETYIGASIEVVSGFLMEMHRPIVEGAIVNWVEKSSTKELRARLASIIAARDIEE